MTKKKILKKIEFYTKEITKKKPWFDTVFRIYYDSLVIINKILYHVHENPWHPDNDYREDIFMSIKDLFEELEEIRIKSQIANEPTENEQ